MGAAEKEIDSLPSLLEQFMHEPEDELARVLWHAHVMLIKHPVAARAAFRAISAEGRRFATTKEGKRYKARLAGSELIRRGRSVWELATLGMLNETPSMLPTQFVDMLAYAAGLTDLEPALALAVEPTTTALMSNQVGVHLLEEGDEEGAA
jgi:hypothetical protein